MKVLILSFFFPPCNGIPAPRPYSWSKEFPKAGMDTTVITRHWTGKEMVWDEYIAPNKTPRSVSQENGSTIIRLPFEAGIQKTLATAPIINKLAIPMQWMSGTFSPEVSCDFMYDEALKVIKEKQIDFVMITAPPINLARLAHRIHEATGVPFAVDYRDCWDNELSKVNYQPTPRRKFFIEQYEKHAATWLKDAAFLTTVSPSYCELLPERIPSLGNKPVYNHPNGYDPALLDTIPLEKPKKFTAAYTGTMYAFHEFQMQIDGIKLFLADKDPGTVEFLFPGITAEASVAAEYSKQLPSDVVKVMDRIPRIDALKIMKNAHILLAAGHPSARGWYTGKFVEYLGVNRNVLLCPSDLSSCASVLDQTRCGKSAASAQAMADQLNLWYAEWQQNGELAFDGIPEEYSFYSRETQGQLLAQNIKKALN